MSSAVSEDTMLVNRELSATFRQDDENMRKFKVLMAQTQSLEQRQRQFQQRRLQQSRELQDKRAAALLKAFPLQD